MKLVGLLIIFFMSVNAHAFFPTSPARQKIRPHHLRHNVIYRGTKVSETGESWKSTVGLYLETTGQSTGFWCTGHLTRNDAIVTAAHCLKKDFDSITVYFYRGSEIANSKTLSTGDYFQRSNPQFVSGSVGSHDQGVIVAKEDLIEEGTEYKAFEYVYSEIASTIDIGAKVYIAGTGRVSAWESDSNSSLYFSTGRIVGYGSSGESLNIEGDGGSGTCGGDSGSPILVKSAGQFYVAGILSGGPSNLGGTCGTTTIAALLTASDVDWIQSQLDLKSTIFSEQ